MSLTSLARVMTRPLCAVLLLTAASPASHAAGWVQTWGAAPLPPSQTMGPMPGTPAFENQTLRQTVRISFH